MPQAGVADPPSSPPMLTDSAFSILGTVAVPVTQHAFADVNDWSLTCLLASARLAYLCELMQGDQGSALAGTSTKRRDRLVLIGSKVRDLFDARPPSSVRLPRRPERRPQAFGFLRCTFPVKRPPASGVPIGRRACFSRSFVTALARPEYMPRAKTDHRP